MVQISSLFGSRLCWKIIMLFVENPRVELSQTAVIQKAHISKRSAIKWLRHLEISVIVAPGLGGPVAGDLIDFLVGHGPPPPPAHERWSRAIMVRRTGHNKPCARTLSGRTKAPSSWHTAPPWSLTPVLGPRLRPISKNPPASSCQSARPSSTAPPA